MVNLSDEIQPYVVYRIDGDQMACALWQLKDGPKAIALFLSGDSATSYIESTNRGTEWKIFCPAKEALGQLLKAAFYQAGIGYAVLEPDLEKAKRIFKIHDMLRTIEDQADELFKP